MVNSHRRAGPAGQPNPKALITVAFAAIRARRLSRLPNTPPAAASSFKNVKKIKPDQVHLEFFLVVFPDSERLQSPVPKEEITPQERTGFRRDD